MSLDSFYKEKKNIIDFKFKITYDIKHKNIMIQELYIYLYKIYIMYLLI